MMTEWEFRTLGWKIGWDEAMKVFANARKAGKKASELFPKKAWEVGTKENGFNHCLWSCYNAADIGENKARIAGENHERVTGDNSQHDLNNNEIGFDIIMANDDADPCLSGCLAKYHSCALWTEVDGKLKGPKTGGAGPPKTPGGGPGGGPQTPRADPNDPKTPGGGVGGGGGGDGDDGATHADGEGRDG